MCVLTLVLRRQESRQRTYSAWRPGYDAHEPSRVRTSITNGRVYRKAEDSNDLVLLFDVADVAKTKAWTAGDDLKTTMQKGWVSSVRR